MLCKTIILSNSQNLNNSPKGILTLSNENNYIMGKIRLYNITTLPKSTKIGLYIDEKVYTSPINKKPNHYEFVLTENIDITKSVYCALIDTSNNKQVILEGGSFNGFYFTDSPFDAVMEAKDPELEEQITKSLQDESNCSNCNCENCEYKKYFYDNYTTNHSSSNVNNLSQDTNTDNQEVDDIEQAEITESSKPQEPIVNLDTAADNSNPITNFQNNVIPTLEKQFTDELKSASLSTLSTNDYREQINNDFVDENADNSLSNDTDLSQREKLEFLNDIVYQLDEMFLRYPEDNTIENIIPNSKFVSVDGENPYVLGAIYENNIMKYIAYGVPAPYNSLPPKDLGNHYQWLPLNPRDVMSDGYFMIYQNALTGSIVEIDFK